jgi:hypothetical protein
MPGRAEVVRMGCGSLEARGREGLEGERVVELEGCVGGHGGATTGGVEEGWGRVDAGGGGEGYCSGGT